MKIDWKSWLKNKFVWLVVGGVVFTLLFAKLDSLVKKISAYAVVLAGLLMAHKFFKLSIWLVVAVLVFPTMILLGDFLPSKKRFWINGREYDASVEVEEVYE